MARPVGEEFIESPAAAAQRAVDQNQRLTETVRHEGDGILRRNPDDVEADNQRIVDAYEESDKKAQAAKPKNAGKKSD